MITNKPHVEIRQRFIATPEKVFAAFADPRLVVLWLSPSPEVKLSLLRFDSREGGNYRFAYHLPDGKTVIVARTWATLPASA